MIGEFGSRGIRFRRIQESGALAQSETQEAIIAAELEKGLAAETTERTQVITLALAAFGATWLLTRGRR
jgi:hypothetical protein